MNYGHSKTTKMYVELCYDFGMLHVIEPYLEIWENLGHYTHAWNVDQNSSVKEQAEAIIKTSLIAALRHNVCEINQEYQLRHDMENYSPTYIFHKWALRGWLRDRAKFPWNP